MHKILDIIALMVCTAIIAAFIESCSAPKPMSAPPPPPERAKMCVGHDCREMGAKDGGGTTRGHTDEKTD